MSDNEKVMLRDNSEGQHRAFVAIDVENLWYASREAYGKNYRVDFDKLRRLLIASLPPDTMIEAIAYVVISPTHDNSMFVSMLERLSYVVKKRYMLYSKTNNTSTKTDMDVFIAVDTTRRACFNEFDTFVLVSGDGDYFYLCEEMARLNKNVEVFTFSNVCSGSLKRVADRVTLLDEDVVLKIRENVRTI